MQMSMLWERRIYANPTTVHRGDTSKYLPMGWSYFLASYILPLCCFPFCVQPGFSGKGNFLTVFVCCCYRITHTALRWDELCFAQLLSGTDSKWQWSKIARPNSRRSPLGFRSELQTCEEGRGVENRYCWKTAALPGLETKSSRDRGRTWLCSHVERFRSERARRRSRPLLPVSVAAVMPEIVEVQQLEAVLFP